MSVKHGDTEVLFQEPAKEPLEPSSLASEALEIRDQQGFFTPHGIEKIVTESKYVKNGDSLKDSILVFSTEKQHTWLVATNSKIFFILDDERTRANQRLIQIVISLEDALPIDTLPESNTSGIFQLGKSKYWYYSYDLLGPPSKAAQRLSTFVLTVKNANKEMES